jgi:pilus assembly protein FimV
MHQNIRSTLIPFGLKALCAAVASALVCFSSANAAGLGKLTVLSSLGQPLRAEIELTSVAKDEAGSLVVKMAPADVFRQANIDFNPLLTSLRFTIDQRSGRQYIRVTSSQAINEPFVDMLLELGSANGRLVREYTFLLDPADLRAAQPAQVAAPISVPAASVSQPAPVIQPESRQPAPQLPVAKPVAKAPAAKQETAPKETGNQSDYHVKKGDTLAAIAGRVKPEGVSLDQMLVGLYRANPDAFSGNNMNRLRSGQILLVPTTEAAQGVSKNEAKNIVLAQAADFNSYRNRLAGMVANATPNKAEEVKQSAGGKISAKVEERSTAASEAKDKLKLSKAANASSPEKSLGAATSAEDKIAKDKAVADANARVKELEKNVNDLQKILEVKSKDMAAAQQKQAESAALAKPAASAKPAVVAPASATASTNNLKPETKPQPAAVIPPAPTAAPAPTSATVTAAASTPPAAVAKPPKPVAKPVVKPKPVVVPVQPEPSLLDELMQNSTLLAAVGAVIAGFGGLGIYYSRRKKKNAGAVSRATDDASLTANSLFGSTGGQSVDTSNSVFNSHFAPSASQLDANEVDPVAEADVYIAYGRDAQAEEILKEALRTQPERNAVRLKLLEIYAARKDVRLFDMQASELYSMTRGEGEEWALAATMGLAIDPNNPLYAGGELPDDAPAKAAPLHSLTQPLEDLDPDALLGSMAQQDSLDSTEIKLDDAGLEGDWADQSAKQEVELDINEVASDVTANGLDFDLSEPATQTTPAFPSIAAEKSSLADLDFDLGAPTVPKEEFAPVLASAAVAEAAPSLNDLSFDLDMPSAGKASSADATTFGGAANAVDAGATVDVKEKSAEFSEMDFDLGDFGSTTAQTGDTQPLQVATENAGFDDFDFDLGDPLPEASQSSVATSAESPSAVKEDISLDFDDLDSFQPAKIDLPAVANATAGSAPEIELAGIDGFELPVGMVDIDAGRETTEATEVPLPEPVPFDVDLSAISLDLTSAELPEEPKMQDDSAAFGAEIVIPGGGDSEMATKLDLAAAYQEIGDKEGARELLDEVIAGGSADQIKTAREMRSKLA